MLFLQCWREESELGVHSSQESCDMKSGDFALLSHPVKNVQSMCALLPQAWHGAEPDVLGLSWGFCGDFALLSDPVKHVQSMCALLPQAWHGAEPDVLGLSLGF